MSATGDELGRSANSDDFCDRFEQAWKQQRRPALVRYLREAEGLDGESRRQVMADLCIMDLQHRLLAGDEAPSADDYFALCPPLREDREGALDLIATEYETRWRREPGVTRSDYLGRFHEYENLGARLNPRWLCPNPRCRRMTEDVDEAAQQVTCKHCRQTSPVRPAPTVSQGSSGSAVQSGWPVIHGFPIEGELGRGGMGVVYKARQDKLSRVVALKMILTSDRTNEDDLQRFRTDAQTLARMQHPNIVQVFDIGEHQGHPFFSLEFCGGGSLDKKLAGTPLPPRDAARLVQQLAHAMYAAHQAGIIHRDLKPANVLLTEDGTPKITDFGLAKRVDADPHLTQSNAIIGTPSYMAPEQAEGKKDIGPAADIYGLGAILYELLTGKAPFKAATSQETIRQVVAEEPLPPSQLQRKTPRDLETICLKCLEKEPGQRYVCALDLADDLCRFFEDKPILARPPSRWEWLRKWARRHPAWAALVGVVAASFILVTALGIDARTEWHRAELARQGEEAQRIAAEQSEQRAKTEAAKATAVKEFLRRDLLELAAAREQQGQEAAGVKMDPDLKVRDLVLRAIRKIEGKFQDQPLVEAEIRMTLGYTLLEIGRADLAIAQFLRVREIYTARLGLDHPDTLDSMNNLAASYYDLGRYAEALKLHEETLALRKAKLGPDHPDTLGSMHNRATSYYALGRYPEARKLHEETLSLRRATFGPDHLDTLGSMNDLANCLAALGRKTDALKLREETLALRKSKLGADHPDTLASRNNLAASYTELGRHAEALKINEETLALRKAKLGPDHPDTLISMNNVAESYAGAGRHADALKLRQETLALMKAKLGADHPNTLVSMANLADSLITLNRGAEAVRIIDECLRRAAGKVVYPQLIPMVMELRLRHYEKSKDVPGCRKTAEMWEMLNRTDPDSLYTAAAMRGVSAGVIRAGDKSEVATKDAGAEADRAMAWLRRAVAAGYKNGAHMASDKDLNALRDREDFRKLMAALEARNKQGDK